MSVNTTQVAHDVHAMAIELDQLRRAQQDWDQEKQKLTQERDDAIRNRQLAEKTLQEAQPLFEEAKQLKAENEQLKDELATSVGQVQTLQQRLTVAQNRNRRFTETTRQDKDKLNELERKVRSLNGSVSYLTHLKVIEGTPADYQPLTELLTIISRKHGYHGNIVSLAAHYNIALAKPKGDTPMSLGRRRSNGVATDVSVPAA
jgi:chromosome segregation ATPase